METKKAAKAQLAAVQAKGEISKKEADNRSMALRDAEHELEFLSMVSGHFGDLGYYPDSELYIALDILLRHVQRKVRIAMGRPADDRWGDPGADGR